MRKRKSMAMENAQSGDLSELLQLALSNLGYTRERQIHYVFLVEEALAKWRSELPEEALLQFERADTASEAKIILSLAGKKCDPFAVAPEDDGEGMSVEHMIDRLLSGVGSEIGYRYRHGVNQIVIRLPKADIDNSLFRRSLIVLMIPIALQVLLENVANNIDAFMLGFLSAADMSAVSLAAKYISIHTFILNAMTLALSVLCAQYWGVRDRKSIEEVASLSMKLSLIVSAVFFAVTALFPDRIMHLYTDDAQFIAGGARYLRIVSVSFLLSPLYRLPYAVMRSTGRVSRSVLYPIIGCVTNILLNGVLIFGLFGLPAMGITGAALATVLSGVLQLGLVAVDSIREKSFRIRFFKASLFASPLASTFFSSAFPTIIQHLVCILGVNIVTAAIGHMDAEIVAANSILLILAEMISSIRSGIGSAAGMLMGNLLGKGRLEEAEQKSHILLKIGLRIGVVTASVFAVAAYCVRFLPMALSAEAIADMNVLIVFYFADVIFAMMNLMINNGMLHPGGDARGLLLMDTIAMWGILVPFALIGSHLPFIPPLLFTGFLKTFELISFPFKYARSKKGIWLRSIVKK